MRVPSAALVSDITPRIAAPSSRRRNLDETDAPRMVRAIVEGRSVDLSRREYALLECLAGSAGRVVSHEQLVECVWGSTSPRYLTQLRSYIKLLRQKIEPDPQHPRYIRSRARMGYVLTAAPRVRSNPG